MESQKLFTFALFSILAVFLFAGLASATTNLQATVTDITVNHDAGSATFTVTMTNEGAADTLTLTADTFVGLTAVTFPGTVAIGLGNVGAPSTVTITGTATFAANQAGPLTANITVTDSLGNAVSDQLDVDLNKAYTFTSTATTEITTSQSGVLTLNNTGNTALTLLYTIATGADFDVTLSKATSVISAGASDTVTLIPATSTTVANLPFGTNTVTIKATDSLGNAQAITTDFSVDKTFCSAGTQGSDLILKEVTISSDGSDDEAWEPLDIITVDVEMENIGTVDIDDVVVEFELFDTDGSSAISDLDFINDEEDKIEIGRIKDDKKDAVTFQFKVPADFEDGDYLLTVKAYSDDLLEANACDDTVTDFNKGFYQDIEVDTDPDNLVVVDNIQLSASTAEPGDTVRITFDVYNVGDNDEDQVRINLINSDLEIILSEEIKQGIDSGDGEELELSFTVPATIADGTYSIAFDTDYDYDSRNDEYDESSSDTWRVNLEVIGAADVVDVLEVSIAATLETSEVKAGKEMVISATITNDESTPQSFVIDAKDFSDWASLVSISDRLVTLDAGESAEIEFTFQVDKGVSGSEAFTIEVLAGEKLSIKSVAVNNITDSSLFSGLGDNSLIWIIGIINVVLILLIIIVAIKLSR